MSGPVSSHTIGEAMAYFRWRTLSNCGLPRCLRCDLQWDAMRNRTDEEVAK